MSTSNKNETLVELKKLLTNIKNLEYAKKELDSCEKKLKEAKEISTYDAYFDKKPTDQYQKERQKYISENKNRKETQKRTFLIVSIVILIALAVFWACMATPDVNSAYLQTPEIIKEYSGMCIVDNVYDLDIKLNITSCDENGAFQGTLEFFDYDSLAGTNIHGKFSTKGQITSKSREGYINATLSFDKWIEETTTNSWRFENAFKEMPLKISGNHQVIRNFTNELYACSADYKPQAITDLNTPEIINTYSGKFDPGIGYVSDASITIQSCDASGKVVATFEYSFKEGYFQGDDKWKLDGQITNKYDDGSVIIEFVPTEAIYNNYQLYDAETMTVEIYDNYRSVESDEGINWYYEDTGFAKDPDPLTTPTHTAFKASAPIVFPVLIALIVVVYVILSRQKTDVLTNAQKRKLDELNAQDAKNRQENQKAQQIAMEKESERKQSEIVACTSKLNHAADRVAMYAYECANVTILHDDDKTVDNIEFLIHKLESGRADTLKEALHLLDDEKERRKERNARAFWEFQESQRRAQEAANARADQIYHNMNVEYEQRKQTKELEKIREYLEDNK